MVCIGCNLHGNKNEIEIAHELNNKKYKNLNKNLKGFIDYILIKENILIKKDFLIKAEVLNTKSKNDISISFNNYIFYISVKSGQGNSFHQENCDNFIEYIQNELCTDEDICKDIKWFISSTKYSTQLKKEYPERIRNINRFLFEHRNELIERFIKTGINNDIYPNYLYYGNINKGQWIEINELINNIKNTPSRAMLKIGGLSLQAWNRHNIDRQNSIQIKFSSIKKSLI